MNKYIPVAARLLIAQLFLVLGLFKVVLAANNPNFYPQFVTYLGAYGLPYIVAPLSFLIEIGAGLALFLGFKTRVSAWILVAYSAILAIALATHLHVDPIAPVLTMLFVVAIGGLLALVALAPTACSLDNLLKKK